ncbi:uncharacterized protein A4U43_C05F370 [Asparagus officinalis]|uniref:Cell number regulator 5 n=1 Tax=Asparagus officinalis TaxID=4686 RepID=A0A5P1EN85_ASPOF|nr:cell number regulator 5 [Asparagus officinalis]ONK67468.1 uncharacterized protein A4U43_C05F370 [Asparagus officinalis]
MKGKGGYVPPLYVPLGQSDVAIEDLDSDQSSVKGDGDSSSVRRLTAAKDPTQWSSGICACCDDMQSCCIGTVCPCYLFGKNAEFLGSGTLAGSCMTHFILWGLLNSLCCMFSGGILTLVPGSTVACYACGYRRALRAKYNIQEAPCGDLTTHMFCHLCAVCQEYREICDRSDGSISVLAFPAVTPPAIQTMESNPVE